VKHTSPLLALVTLALSAAACAAQVGEDGAEQQGEALTAPPSLTASPAPTTPVDSTGKATPPIKLGGVKGAAAKIRVSCAVNGQETASYYTECEVVGNAGCAQIQTGPGTHWCDFVPGGGHVVSCKDL
jgi:hypothetical protein